MPRIWYEQGFSFSFYASDGQEPPDVHVFKGGAEGKWWLEGPREEWNHGHSAKDRSRIRRIIIARRGTLLQRWHGFFSPPDGRSPGGGGAVQ